MPKQSYIATVEGQVWVQETVRYLGLTQEQIADQANLKTRTSVGKLIKGKRVERGAFKRICNCLDLDYRAIAGLTLPSLPNAASITDPSSEAQVSVREPAEVRRQLCFLQDELSGMRVDPRTLMDQGTRPLQGIAYGEESDSAVPAQGMFDASDLQGQEEVAVELMSEGASFEEQSPQPTSGTGSGVDVRILPVQTGKVEGIPFLPKIKFDQPRRIQPLIVMGSSNTNPLALPAAKTSGEVPSSGVGSTEATQSSLFKWSDHDSKEEKRKGGRKGSSRPMRGNKAGR